jgi:ABC-type transporter Mla maintaining outer membrane lipid asymmetry permease subunit MlaE
MSNPIHIILLLALIGGFVVPAVLVARLADRRGRSFTVYLLASLLVSWVVPLIAVLVLPDRRKLD